MCPAGILQRAGFQKCSGVWYGTFFAPEVIMYNSRRLDSASVPIDWDDLLDPRWKGKIIIRSPLASGTMRMIFCGLIDGNATGEGAWRMVLTGYVAWMPTRRHMRRTRHSCTSKSPGKKGSYLYGISLMSLSSRH